jgi:adenylate cyclase
MPVTERGSWVPLWALFSFVAALAVHLSASYTTAVSIELMRSVSPFADEVRKQDLAVLPYYRVFTYTWVIAFVTYYLWPILVYFRCDARPAAAPDVVRRRAVSFPAVGALVGMFTWSVGAVVFPLLTLWRFGHWSAELMSQHVLSVLVNGFLAATTSYLLVDWIFRTRVIPQVFPDGRVHEVPGAITFGVRSRLLIYLAAVAFLPLFTMLGLARTAGVRYAEGVGVEQILAQLASGGTGIFFIYVFVGLTLTLVLARTFTRPLAEVIEVLGDVRRGDLEARVAVQSTDEVGQLQDGLNAMIEGLRDRERILTTFGRVVEPAIRDRLLAGNLREGGETRTVSVLFCDLRGFTTLAEATAPEHAVATLNEFFTVITAWVRSCGGFVDKFIGDALLAVFGLFDGDGVSAADDGAAAALRCALGIRERMAELNRKRAARGEPALAVTMSLHTGPVVAGMVGAAERHEYTVIGDTVNIAARLQEVAKERDFPLVLSAESHAFAERAGLRVEAARRDSFVPRGRNQAVTFCVLG